MRISGPNGPAAPAATGIGRRSTQGSFSLPQDDATPTPSGTGTVRTLGGIEDLAVDGTRPGSGDCAGWAG